MHRSQFVTAISVKDVQLRFGNGRLDLSTKQQLTGLHYTGAHLYLTSRQELWYPRRVASRKIRTFSDGKEGK